MFAAVQVVVGPVAAESVGAFSEFGRAVLHGQGPGAEVPSDAAAAFEGYLDEWDELGGATGDVTWATEVDGEVVEYLAYAFFRVATEINEEAGLAQVVPTPAAPFYWMLVRSLLGALEGEGGSRAEFAAHLREFWPGETDVSE